MFHKDTQPVIKEFMQLMSQYWDDTYATLCQLFVELRLPLGVSNNYVRKGRYKLGEI